MPPCKFFQQGYCKYGRNCKFEHVKTGNNNNSNNNSYSGSNSRTTGVFGARSETERWQLNEDDIRADLTSQRPKWILSSYGPAKDLPGALLTDNEYSPEEVRWKFYQRRLEVGENAANQEAVDIWHKTVLQMQQIAQNTKDVVPFMVEKEKERPNRYNWVRYEGNIPREDFINKEKYNSLPGSSMTPWGGPGTRSTITNRNTFSAAGQNESPFSKTTQASPFGQPAQSNPFVRPANSTGFGQPTTSLFGGSTTPAFGQSGFDSANAASAAGSQDATPAFGQSGFGAIPFSQPTGGSAFGQPSGSGQNANQNPFGKPSAFGAATNTNGSTFGQPANNSPFHGPAQNNNASPFGQGNNQSTFGAAAPNPAFAKPTFRQSSGFGQQPAPGFGQTAFGQASQMNGFGQQAPQQNVNPFNQPPQPALGQQSAAFGTQQPPQFPASGQPQQSNQNPFGGLPSGQSQDSQLPSRNAFGRTSSPSLLDPIVGVSREAITPVSPVMSGGLPLSPIESRQKPTIQPVQPLHYSQTLPNTATTFNGSKPSMFRGQPVKIEQRFRPTLEGTQVLDAEIPIYQRPDGKGSERIWFPGGGAEQSLRNLPSTPLYYHIPDDQMSDADKEAYGLLFSTGKFQDHKIPLVPPSMGWIDYNF